MSGAPEVGRAPGRAWFEIVECGAPGAPASPTVLYPARGGELTPPSPPLPRHGGGSERPGEGPFLPGSGEPGRDCGMPVVRFCLDCGHRFEITHECGLRLCPTCYVKWAGREARTAAAAVAARRGGERVAHVVVSLRGAPSDVWRFRSRAERIAKKHGALSGSCVAHAWREGDGPGDWVADGYLHYHMICTFGPEGFITLDRLIESDFLEHNGHVCGRYDWIFKVIRQGERTGRPTYWLRDDQLSERFYYQLEHAAVGRGRHALTWWGEWWNGEPAPAPAGGVGTPPAVPCPRCGSENTIVRALTEEPYDVVLPSERWGRGRPAGTVLNDWEPRRVGTAGAPARGDVDPGKIYRLSGYSKVRGRWVR